LVISREFLLSGSHFYQHYPEKGDNGGSELHIRFITPIARSLAGKNKNKNKRDQRVHRGLRRLIFFIFDT